MRILMLGINYSPEKTGIAPYTTGLARHLSKKHEVTVLTGVPHYPDWRVDASYKGWRYEETDGRVRVIRLSHFVPRAPSPVGRALYELTWAIRALIAGLKVPTDLVIAVVPALLSAPVARVIATAHRARVGIFVQDIVSAAAAQSGYPGGAALQRATALVERAGLRYADGVTTIHPRLANELSRIGRTRAKPTVIYNWSHVTVDSIDTGTQLRTRLGCGGDEILALHSGNMGTKQNLEVLVDAARIAEDRNAKVRFILAGEGSERRRLERYANDCTQLSFLPSVADAEYFELLQAADVLLVNERPGIRDMSLPSKLTSYLLAGKPIVAAVEPQSATHEFLSATGGGVTVPAGNPAAVLEAVTRLGNDSSMATDLAASGRRFAENHLTPHEAFASYDAWIEEILHVGA